MKLEETLNQRDIDMTGPPSYKKVSHDPEEEKKAASDPCQVDIEGTADPGENQREASDI